MLIRIVRLDLRPEKVADFLQLFEENKDKIASSEGCFSLELKRDARFSNVIYTYSTWDNEESLNNYRKSDFFSVLWPQITALFKNRVQVFSLLPLEK